MKHIIENKEDTLRQILDKMVKENPNNEPGEKYVDFDYVYHNYPEIYRSNDFMKNAFILGYLDEQKRTNYKKKTIMDLEESCESTFHAIAGNKSKVTTKQVTKYFSMHHQSYDQSFTTAFLEYLYEQDLLIEEKDQTTDEIEITDDIVRDYLKQIHQIPTLTEEEERSVALEIRPFTKHKEELDEKVKQTKKAITKLKIILSQPRSLTEDTKKKYLEQYKKLKEILEKQNQEVYDYIPIMSSQRNKLVEPNLRWAFRIASAYFKRGVPPMDVVQEANKGLIRAAEKFDPSMGKRFTTYSYYWIKQFIAISLGTSGTIRLPYWLSRELKIFSSKCQNVKGDNWYNADSKELSELLNIPIDKVQFLLEITNSQTTVSFDEPVGDGKESTFKDFIPDTDSSIQEQYEDKELEGLLNNALDSLGYRSAMILKLYYGLISDKTYTLEEIGQMFGITRERVRQLKGVSLRRMRYIPASRELKEYRK